MDLVNLYFLLKKIRHESQDQPFTGALSFSLENPAAQPWWTSPHYGHLRWENPGKCEFVPEENKNYISKVLGLPQIVNEQL